MGRRVLTVILVVAAAVVAVVALAWAGQRRLIYLPDQHLPPPPERVEALTYTTSAGLELEGWWVPAQGAAEAAVVVFNGNAGNRADRLPLGRELASRGMHVLLTDYRGYGGNPGSPTETGLQRDAAAARQVLERRAPGLPHVYFGESLGGAVATRLATRHPPAALVLRSPFTSLAEVATIHYPLPAGLLLKDRFEVETLIGSVEAPVLVIAGEEDWIVPPRLSREVFEAATDPKRWVLVDGVSHNDAALAWGREVVGAVAEFVTGHGA